MKVLMPRMGTYSELISQGLSRYLGWEVTLTPPPTDRSTELGSKYMNELMCLPAKVTLGSFIEAGDNGIRDLLMFDSCGQCRLKTYWILQERALRKLGHNVTVHPVRLGWGAPSDIRAVDRSLPYWKAWWAFIKLLQAVKQFDGGSGYEIPDESDLPRVGIVGEIYSILEPAVNKHLIRKIEKMGALVHNALPLSYFIFKGLYNRGWMKRRGMDSQVLRVAKKQAHGYFPKEIGGHGNESIIHSIYYGLRGFDGIIHIIPFPCMPESTVATIIDDIGRDYSIPVMRLIFDVHSGEAGLDTRLEAFIDMLFGKKRAGYAKNKLPRESFLPERLKK